MAVFSISGNAVTANEIIYLFDVKYVQPSQTTVSDASGNFTFSNLAGNTTYAIYSASGGTTAKVQVPVIASNFTNVNLSK